MAERAGRFAWLTLWIAFATFCFTVASVPVAIHWYLEQAMSPRPVTLDLIRGTTLLRLAGRTDEVNAANQISLAEGDQVRTAPDSQALLSFFDGSNIRLWPGTTVRLAEVRSSTYNDRSSQVVLVQDSGHARYEVALPATGLRQFEVRTPDGTALLREGSYAIDAGRVSTEVDVRSGSATVSNHIDAVEVLQNERTFVKRGLAPSRPQSAQRNLLVNGGFTQGFTGWQQGNRAVEDNIPGRVIIRDQDNRQFAEFRRSGSNKHAETYLHQNVKQDVTDFAKLEFDLDLRIQEQSLAGGGWLGSEYPLLIRVHYRTSDGIEETWVHGFYIQNKDDHPTYNGEQIPKNLWVERHFNLFDQSLVSPRPAEILWIEVGASGWSFVSGATNVGLVAE